jgi:hypothetical protein
VRVRLSGGAYSARSIISSCQRSVNLYSEQGPPGAIIDAQTGQGVGQPLAGGVSGGLVTLYPTPGLRVLATPSTPGRARGLYRANNGVLFYVCGSKLYTVSPAWVCKAIGSLGYAETPVSMADNGTTMVLVDGTSAGYTVDLATLVFAQMSSAPYPAGNAPTTESTMVYGWIGSDRVAVLNGYLLFNQPGTRNFYSTYNSEVVFDSLYIAAKNGFSDNLVAAVVNQRSIWLIGERTAEIWFDSGAADFPFALMDGPFVQHGCAAKYSIAQTQEAILWLSQDQSGSLVVVRTNNYAVARVSTHALEAEWATYPAISDAQAFCFSHGGHNFYQINFPSADTSWRYDLITGEWHQAVWSDSSGAEHRHRAACVAYTGGLVVVADWETGLLYALDPAVYTDAGAPIMRLRDFPHIVGDGDRVFYRNMMLDMSVGNSVGTSDPPGPFPVLNDDGSAFDFIAGPAPPADTSPQVLLSWSDDRGRTFGNPVAGSIGATGEYLTSIQFNRLGMARDRVFRVKWSAPVNTALQGAFIAFEKAAS